ncbi:hypothetical protein CEXT_240091 [Caerostris extrusa]|uniref:Uncharacterized protein n=1 Tax=Caerostris extrusa TaxID=172846 RepID=A0AAV4PV88_CAEEX|nr:hypothetical protein CEXT_240091 [Caerostris extrusa]
MPSMTNSECSTARGGPGPIPGTRGHHVWRHRSQLRPSRHPNSSPREWTPTQKRHDHNKSIDWKISLLSSRKKDGVDFSDSTIPRDVYPKLQYNFYNNSNVYLLK